MVSRLGLVWNKAEGSNRANSNNQNFIHGRFSDDCVPSLTAHNFTPYCPV